MGILPSAANRQRSRGKGKWKGGKGFRPQRVANPLLAWTCTALSTGKLTVQPLRDPVAAIQASHALTDLCRRIQDRLPLLSQPAAAIRTLAYGSAPRG